MAVGGFADDPHTQGIASDTPGVEGVGEDFWPDNVHWDDRGRLITAGMRPRRTSVTANSAADTTPQSASTVSDGARRRLGRRFGSLTKRSRPASLRAG